MAGALTPAEQAQLQQTIDMFKVIVQSQPLDYQSLEILKEAYMKLGLQQEVVTTSKMIAEAYVQLGQLSSAIMEYETILQQFPDDPDVKRALEEIESKTTSFSPPTPAEEPRARDAIEKGLPAGLDDGKATMRKLFVDGKIINAEDFEKLWKVPGAALPGQINEPFVQLMADKGVLGLDQSVKLLLERARIGYIPLEKYDVDMDLARTFPRDVCGKWCVLPFDKMSKTVFVATANPFNKQAEKELAAATKNRVLWYLASPTELVKTMRKVFR